MDPSALTLEHVGAALAALSALATAAFGLLDSSKVFSGGVSNVGLGHIRAALQPFAPALDAAAGPGQWWLTIRANWLNGLPKIVQKATAANLVKLGLSPATAPAIAAAGHVPADILLTVARALENGQPLTTAQVNVIGRLEAVLGVILDGAYERAEQQYRNVARFGAGVVALAMAIIVALVFGRGVDDIPFAIIVGLLAVPVAPLAKDLTSALSMAARALKAARAV